MLSGRQPCTQMGWTSVDGDGSPKSSRGSQEREGLLLLPPLPTGHFSPHLILLGLLPNLQPQSRWLRERGCTQGPGISEINCPARSNPRPACQLVTTWMFGKRWRAHYPAVGLLVFIQVRRGAGDTAKLSITVSGVYSTNEALGEGKGFYL